MKSIVVFCGSSYGNQPVYEEQAVVLGQTLARNGIRLIYGGASVGLMGAVANAALQAGGTVIGVIPRFLNSREIAHIGLSELILVESMHERKAKMNELCDGVITLPGGFGTMEELFEMLTWSQLGLHTKPIGLLNTAGYYDPLNYMVKTMEEQGFLKPVYREMLLTDENVDVLLAKMKSYTAPEVPKWISKETT
ncbi:TIGR00730 family Rossman fold protein [Taibaiella chishuiensis]|uniref:Cytokinin riboside 5'-monophosphate phosphoribohydrolase n=1 Tax=Taibaiella chishuiensis TaxID=1434707 RepID=A0A2P8DAX9_9BACT|nr:TIGR00730 family Rossman fold protein [Taibaiella chishuiensis]PSK94373.1 hypothetical protein B0I18_101528 [Taibaiella chishuiensis]